MLNCNESFEVESNGLKGYVTQGKMILPRKSSLFLCLILVRLISDQSSHLLDIIYYTDRAATRFRAGDCLPSLQGKWIAGSESRLVTGRW
jgi:hypothetical protein